MKFKVRCVMHSTSGNGFEKGKIYSVKNGCIFGDHGFTSNRGFETVEDLNRFFVSQFELVEEEKMLTKEDLKTGMVVEYRNGKLSMVMECTKEKALVDDDGCYVRFNALDDELKMITSSRYDVMKIYGLTPNPSMTRNSKTVNRELLWERKEPIKLTTKEVFEIIAKEKGVSVDMVEIVGDLK